MVLKIWGQGHFPRSISILKPGRNTRWSHEIMNALHFSPSNQIVSSFYLQWKLKSSSIPIKVLKRLKKIFLWGRYNKSSKYQKYFKHVHQNILFEGTSVQSSQCQNYLKYFKYFHRNILFESNSLKPVNAKNTFNISTKILFFESNSLNPVNAKKNLKHFHQNILFWE